MHGFNAHETRTGHDTPAWVIHKLGNRTAVGENRKNRRSRSARPSPSPIFFVIIIICQIKSRRLHRLDNFKKQKRANRIRILPTSQASAHLSPLSSAHLPASASGLDLRPASSLTLAKPLPKCRRGPWRGQATCNHQPLTSHHQPPDYHPWSLSLSISCFALLLQSCAICLRSHTTA